MYISNFKFQLKDFCQATWSSVPRSPHYDGCRVQSVTSAPRKNLFWGLGREKGKGLFLSRKCILIMMVFQDCHWVHRVHEGKSKFWTSEKLTFTAVFHRFPSQNPQPHHGLNLDRMVLHRIYHWQHGSLTSKLGVFSSWSALFPFIETLISPPIGWWCHRHPPRSTAPCSCHENPQKKWAPQKKTNSSQARYLLS